MRIAILLIAIVLPLSAAADEWKELVGYSLHDLYQVGADDTLKGMAKDQGIRRKATLLSTNTVQLQGGQFAVLATVEVLQGESKWLYRCFDYYSAKAERTSQKCYELRK